MRKLADDTKLFNALFHQAETLLLDLLVRGFKSAVAVKEACAEYGVHWSTEFGLVLDRSMPGYDAERAKRFVVYLQRRCWNSMHTPHKDENGRSVRAPTMRYRAAMERRKGGRFSGRLWITDVDAVMYQVQRIAERNENRDINGDKAQLEAIRTAYQVLQQKGASGAERPGDDQLRAWFDNAADRQTETAE